MPASLGERMYWDGNKSPVMHGVFDETGAVIPSCCST